MKDFKVEEVVGRVLLQSTKKQLFLLDGGFKRVIGKNSISCFASKIYDFRLTLWPSLVGTVN